VGEVVCRGGLEGQEVCKSSYFVVVVVVVVVGVVIVVVVDVSGGDAERSVAACQQGFDAERVETTGLVRDRGRGRRGQVQQRWRWRRFAVRGHRRPPVRVAATVAVVFVVRATAIVVRPTAHGCHGGHCGRRGCGRPGVRR